MTREEYAAHALDISAAVLTALRVAAQAAPVPYLQQAAAVALSLVKIIQTAKDNKDAFNQLASDTCDLVYLVLCMYEEASKKNNGQSPSHKLVEDLQSLLNKISTIEAFCRKEVSRGTITKLFRHNLDQAKIQEFRDDLRRSLDIFGLRSDVAIRETTNRLLEQNEMLMLQLQLDRKERENERRNQEPHSLQPTATTPTPMPTPVHIEGYQRHLDSYQVPLHVLPSPNGNIVLLSPNLPPQASTNRGGENSVQVTNYNSGNVTTTNIIDSNNDNTSRVYHLGPRGPKRRPRK